MNFWLISPCIFYIFSLRLLISWFIRSSAYSSFIRSDSRLLNSILSIWRVVSEFSVYPCLNWNSFWSSKKSSLEGIAPIIPTFLLMFSRSSVILYWTSCISLVSLNLLATYCLFVSKLLMNSVISLSLWNNISYFWASLAISPNLDFSPSFH